MSVKASRTCKELVEAARSCLADGSSSPAVAGELLTNAVQQDPTYVNALVLRSNLASRVGQLASAAADLSLAIEVDRSSGDGHRLASLFGARANVRGRMGRYADAIADLRAALKFEPDNGMWCFELGRVYVKEGRVSLAQLHFQQTLQEPMWAHVTEAARPRVYALYGRSCLVSRDYKKAKALLRKSLESGGEGAAVLHDVGLAHYYEGTAPATAIEFFSRATEMDPRPLEYPMHLSLTHARCGSYAEAVASMHEAVLRGSDVPLLRFYRGCMELQLGLGPQALQDLQSCIAAPASPGDARGGAEAAARRTAAPAPAWLAMALEHLFCETDALERASACLDAATVASPDVQQHILASLLHGIVLHRRGETGRAMRALMAVLDALKASSTPSSLLPQDGGCSFAADMELLALTHLGFAHSDGGYADLSLRFFNQARQRAVARDVDAARLAVCSLRQVIAQVEVGDYWGALETLRGSSPLHEKTPAAGKAGGRTSSASSLRSTASPSAAPSTPSGKASAAAASSLVCHRLPPGEAAHVHAVVLRRLGQLPEALRLATAAIEAQTAAAASSKLPLSDPRAKQDVASYLYNRALTFFSLGCYGEAMADVQACIRACCGASASGEAAAVVVPPLAADALYLQGRIAHATGQYADALSHLAMALDLDESLPSSPAFSYSHGVLLAIAGLFEEAIDAFTAAIAHSSKAHGISSSSSSPASGASPHKPASHPLLSTGLAAFYHERAKVHQQLEHYTEALQDYNHVLPTPPSTSAAAVLAAAAKEAATVNWNALVNRSLTLKALKRYGEAAADWDAALRLDQSGSLAQFTSQDVYEVPYMDLCQPGCELH